MNLDNLSYLTDALKFLGFGGKMQLARQLEEMIRKNDKEFQLTTDYQFSARCRMDVSLFFRRGDESDRYFLNKYNARIVYEDADLVPRTQTFYISKGRGITCKEAFNLLQGRAVYKGLYNKEGVKYHAWLQLNFAEREYGDNYKILKYYESYGFDLEAVLERFHIREMSVPPLRDALLRSLRRGNIHPVAFNREDSRKRMLIEASPQFKTINIYPEITPGHPAVDYTSPEVVEIPPEEDERDIPFWNDEEDDPDQDGRPLQEAGPKARRPRKKLA